MAKTEHYHTRFDAGHFYHIYNRTVDRQPLFNNDGNFAFFLRKYSQYLYAVADTYAYCLLGNHFHLLIRVKEDFEDVSGALVFTETEDRSVHDIVSHQFQKFFQSYAMAFNKQHERVGTLFQTPFKRALVTNDMYFTKLVYYIHANPQRHGIVNDFRKWKWSSYHSLLSSKPTRVKRHEVLDWFGGMEAFQKYHDQIHDDLTDRALLLDE